MNYISKEDDSALLHLHSECKLLWIKASAQWIICILYKIKFTSEREGNPRRENI